MNTTPGGAPVTLLERRRIEAALLAETHAVLVERLGPEAALSIIEAIVEKAARQAGRAFAAAAPDGPSLAHFASVAEAWRAGGALVIENVVRQGDTFSFDVTRCRYAEAYREMGLPEELATRISCLRDGAFVAGYSDNLRLTRPETIASGARRCPFTFTWENA